MQLVDRLLRRSRRRGSPSSATVEALLTALADGPDPPRVAVLTEAELTIPPGLDVTTFDAAQPRWRIRGRVAGLGPWDVIVDATGGSGRHREHFTDCFQLLGEGGRYVVTTEVTPWLTRLRQPDRPKMPADEAGLRESVASVTQHRGHVIVTRRGSSYAVLPQRHVNAALRADPSRGRILEVVEGVTFAPGTTADIDPADAIARHRLGRVVAPSIHLREYDDVVCAPRSLVLQRNIVAPDTFRRSNHPNLATANLHVAGPWSATAEFDEADAQPLEGTFFHLDDYCRGHFGHGLTDQLSRMWAWERARELDPAVRVLLGRRRSFPRVQDWELELWSAFGIGPDDIELAPGPVRVERLISAQQMLVMPSYVHPAITEVWDRCGRVLRERALEGERPARIFVSRRGGNRSCENLEEVETFFAGRGFAVVYPEDHPLPVQVDLFHRADVVAGFAGSGMLHTLFSDRPKDVILIGPTSYRANNEFLIAAVRNQTIHTVSCPSSIERTPGRLKEAKHSSFRCDLDGTAGARLRGILESL